MISGTVQIEQAMANCASDECRQAVQQALDSGIGAYNWSVWVTLFGAFLTLFAAVTLRLPWTRPDDEKSRKIVGRFKLAVELVGAAFVIAGVAMISTWHQQVLMGTVITAIVALIASIVLLILIRLLFRNQHI